MTRKKIIAIVASGILLFFFTAMIMNFWVVGLQRAEDFRDDFRRISENIRGYDLEHFAAENNKNSAEKLNCSLGELLLYDYVNAFAPSQYAGVFAVREYPDGELHYAPQNFVRVVEWADYSVIFADLDKYMTEEMKKEIAKNNKNYYCSAQEIGFYFNGSTYIPTELVLYDWKGGPDITYKLSSYPTKIKYNEDTEGISIDLCLDEYRAPFYNRILKEKTMEKMLEFFELNKDNGFDAYSNGMVMSASKGVGIYDLRIDGKDYQIVYSLQHNVVMDTLFSDDFLYWTLYLSILFLIAGSIFLVICLKIWKKGQKLDQARKTFISAASHELKTPIAVIQNQCECVMENVAPEKNGEYISSIYDEALRMNAIVSSLLSYNRLTQMSKISKENCNISMLLKEETEKYRSFAETVGAEIVSEITEGIYAECNGEMIKNLADNLLSNAVKYSVGDKKIKVSLSKDKKGFTLSVTNPADEKSRDIKEKWELLSRGDLSRTRDGSAIGMGLPLCRRIIELHSYSAECFYEGGKVTVKVTSSGR